MNTTTETLSLPKRFWEDHVDRACRCDEHCPDRDTHEEEGYGTLLKGRYQVTLTPLDRQELFSDAWHYWTSGTAVYGPEAIGLIASARATAKLVHRHADRGGFYCARSLGCYPEREQ